MRHRKYEPLEMVIEKPNYGQKYLPLFILGGFVIITQYPVYIFRTSNFFDNFWDFQSIHFARVPRDSSVYFSKASEVFTF